MAIQKNLFHLFIVICLKISSIKSQGNDVLDWPLPDEYNAILRTREYIENLKNCGFDPEDGAGLIDPRDTKFVNGDCEGKKIDELFSIKESKMSINERNYVQKLSVEAIKLLNKYSDISNHIEVNIKQRFDNIWFVFTGAKNTFDGLGKSKSTKYYHFNIGDMTIVVFTVSSSSLKNNVHPVQPESIEINFNPHIIENDFNQETTNTLLSLMKASFEEESSNFNKACQMILYQVQSNFNHDQWSCASGLKNKYSFIPGKGEKILVAFGDVIGQITKIPHTDLTLRDPHDVIVEAKENINIVKINQTFMSRKVSDDFVKFTKNIILKGYDYKDISDKIKKASELTFGKSWTAVVGLDTQFWTHFTFSRPLLMNLKIGELRVIAYAH